MTPVIPDYIRENTQINTYPSKTYKIDWKTKRIIGICDGVEAMEQACILHTNTELLDYEIFPDNDYGIKTSDLYGKDVYYVASVLENRIHEALSIDTRVLGFGEYVAYINGTDIEATIEVKTTEGTIDLNYVFDTTQKT